MYFLWDIKDRMMTYCWKWFKFYFFVAVYSIQHLFLHFLHSILHPKRYTQSQENRVCVPPPCLSDEHLGQHQYAKLLHSKFHYVEKGDRSNRLLLLIHGYPEFWYSWRFQLQKLSAYYWVVAIDLKGYGDSDKPASRSEYQVDVMVKELSEFLAAIGRKKCTLITHGEGGMLGWNFLHQYPDMVENFVSISSPHPVSFLQEMELNRVPNTGWYYFCQLPYFPEKECMKQDLSIFDTIFSRMLSNKRGNLTQQDINAFKFAFSRAEDWVGPINHFRTLLKQNLHGFKGVRKSTAPTLFIVGNADPYTSLEMICKSSEFVDNFTLKIVEGGGHFLPQEMPNYVNSLILDFLKLPELESSREFQTDHSIIKKLFGTGKTVMSSTVNYGNQVWTNSVDAVTRGVSIPKKIASHQVFLT